MSDVLAGITERLRQLRVSQAQAAVTRRSSAPALVAQSASLYASGDRVFDTVVGLDGTVTAAGRPNGLKRNEVRVRLDDGVVLVRDASLLIARPR